MHEQAKGTQMGLRCLGCAGSAHARRQICTSTAILRLRSQPHLLSSATSITWRTQCYVGTSGKESKTLRR